MLEFYCTSTSLDARDVRATHLKMTDLCLSLLRFTSMFNKLIFFFRAVDGVEPGCTLWRRYSEFEILRNYLMAIYSYVSLSL